LRRHLRECARCRRFYNEQLSVARGLAGAADRERATPSPFLQGRIMAAVDRSARPAPARFGLRRLVWLAGMAAALALVFRFAHGPLQPRPTLAPADPSTVAREFAALEQRLPDERKLGQWSGSLDQPLDDEMRSLLHDAQNAAQTLAFGFLPDSMAERLSRGQTRD